MKQSDVAGKVLIELLELEVISEENEEITYTKLEQVYAAGYDEGRKKDTHRKPVAQYSVDGKLIKIWESSALAARHFELNKSAISKTALGKQETAAGFRWKFVDLSKPTAAPTIGSMKRKTVRPTPRTHFSRKGSERSK